MEQRTLLAVVLSIAVLVIFQFFFAPPPTEEITQANGINASIKKEKAVPATKSLQPPKGVHQAASSAPSPLRPAKDIVVETPLFKAIFTERGGAVKSFTLKRYRKDLRPDSPPVELFNMREEPLPLSITLKGAKTPDLSEAVFTADRQKVVINTPDGQGDLTFSFTCPDGTTVTKGFHFTGSSYWIEMDIDINGASSNVPPTLHLYNHNLGNQSRYIFSGVSYYTGSGIEEVKLDKGENHNYRGPLEWIGYGDNYFTTTLIPLSPKGEMTAEIKRPLSNDITETLLTPVATPAGSIAGTYKIGLYFGPKEIDKLKALDHNLSKTINFGWFDVIAKPILYALKFLYGFIHNYGWAIIIITIIIKLAFWPLAHKSAKSMKTMQKLQPKLAKLKEKYGDDKERLNRELMQLYRTYKVNPMSGCLPMLLQIPVFFALYKVLLQAIELRHAPFMLWINDLSAPDRLMIPGVDIPFLHGIPVLTLLMGASMYFQQKMSPSSLDPTQAKMMQMLPIVFTFMFINFPSGLVLYWLVNNILSIVQQYYVNKFTE